MFWEDEDSFSLGPFTESCKAGSLRRGKGDRERVSHWRQTREVGFAAATLWEFRSSAAGRCQEALRPTANIL